MLVMVVFFIAFRWIHLSTPLIRLFLLVLILLLMPTLNFLPVWFALSLLRFRLPSRLKFLTESLVDGERSQSKSFSSCARIGRIFSFSASSPLRFKDRKSGSAGMPRPISYAVFCLKKKKKRSH